MGSVFTFPRPLVCCLLHWDENFWLPLAIWPRAAHTVTGPLTCYLLHLDGALWQVPHRDVRLEEEEAEDGERQGEKNGVSSRADGL